MVKLMPQVCSVLVPYPNHFATLYSGMLIKYHYMWREKLLAIPHWLCTVVQQVEDSPPPQFPASDFFPVVCVTSGGENEGVEGAMVTVPRAEERGLEKAGHEGKRPQRKGSLIHILKGTDTANS